MKNTEHSQDQEQEKQDLIKLSTLTIIILIILSLLYSGCYYSCDTYSYLTYNPVYLDMDSLRNEVATIEAKQISDPGGIYYKGGYVFVNERMKGIHIIDDRVPEAPNAVSFLSIPGNFAMAAKGDYLFADSYTDLLVFDISDEQHPTLVKREEHVFQDFYGNSIYYDEQRDAMVTYVEGEWEDTDCGDGGGWQPFFWYSSENEMVVSDAAGGSGDTGESGSMARFVVDGQTLYAVDYNKLHLFDVSVPEKPEKKGDVDLGWGVETIFPHGDQLFIGAMDGMYIMDKSDELHPELLSKYEHTTSCDPVVVQGDYAYVTLRNGTECNGFTNQLDIVDIKNPSDPFLVKTYEMLNPHGLAINNECLFICEGKHGLKVFDVKSSDPTQITQKKFHEGIDAFDVISLPDILLMVGKDGFYQYSYACGDAPLQFLSEISFAPKVSGSAN